MNTIPGMTRTTEQNLQHWRHRRQNPRPKTELDKARKRRAPLPRPEDV